MQNKYLSALKTKYASFGLSKEALDRVALQRVKTIANEDEIDADIATPDTLMLIMKEMQSSADSQRNRATQLQKDLEDLKKNQNPNQNNSQAPEDNPLAAELKAIKEMFEGMKAEMDTERKKAQNNAVIAQVHEVMKKNGCTNDFIRNITLRGIEVGENDTADSIAEKYKSIYDQNCKDAYGEGYMPPMGNHSGSEGENDKDAETAILKRAGLL
jgi:hypothetical protein